MFKSRKKGVRVLIFLAMILGGGFFCEIKNAAADTLVQRIEAESAATAPNTLVAPMRIISSPNDLGAVYIETGAKNQGWATYNIAVPEAGFYKIEARSMAVADDDNSFIIQIDGLPGIQNNLANPGYIWDIATYPSSPSYDYTSSKWKIRELSARDKIEGQYGVHKSGYPYEFYLAAGNHSIKIWGGEYTKPRCSNGTDDDSDGKIDYPNDLQCASNKDNDEGSSNPILAEDYYTAKLDYFEVIKIESVAKKWEPYEVRLLSANSYTNAYTQDVAVTGTFRHTETNQQITVKGFWNGKNFDGKDKFIVKFTPTEEGEWLYEITNNQTDVGLAKSGSLVADSTHPDNHGFVRVDKDNPTSFVYDDGERYFMFGTTAYDIMENSLDELDREDWKRTIDFLSTKKINKVRFFLFPFSSNVGTSQYLDQMPFAGSAFAPSRDTLRIGYWQQVEEVIKYMKARGIVAELILFANEERDFGTDAQDNRYVKYAVSRFAAYPNVIWDLANEWDYRIMNDKTRRSAKSGDAKISRNRWNQVGNLVYAEDPWSSSSGGYRRLLSIHEAGGVNSANQETPGIFDFFNEPWASYAIIQVNNYNIDDMRSAFLKLAPYTFNSIKNVYDSYVKFEEMGNYSIFPNFDSQYNSDRVMPVVNDEYGYVGESSSRDGNRKILWGIYAAGGYAAMGDAFNPDGKISWCDSIDGGKKNFKAGNYYDGNYTGTNTACGTNMGEAYSDATRLINFFTTKNIEYWKMRTHNELIGTDASNNFAETHAYVLANPGVDYVVYDADGGEFVINLEAGKTYNVTKFDPRTSIETNLPATTGGEQIFNTGDTQDWVYRIQSVSDSISADVNSDGHINIKDIQACIKVITNSQTDTNIISKCNALAAPIGNTNIKDIQVIIRKIINP